MSRIAVILNPVSGGGRGKKIWAALTPRLKALFSIVDSRVSNHEDDIEHLTQICLKDKPDYLLVIGGDGSLNHALNGFISEDKVPTATTLAFFSSGCAGDYLRPFPKQDITEFLDRLKHHQTMKTNVGKVVSSDQSVRYFINIASCGFSAHVAYSTQHNRWLKKLGRSSSYFLSAVINLITYKATKVKIQIDDHQPLEGKILLMAVSNGQYFGGGMQVAPLAKIDDDLLDVVIFYGFNTLSALFKLRKIYSGRHLLEKSVHYIQGKKITIIPLEQRQLPIESDGEKAGQTPANFELLKTSIELII